MERDYVERIFERRRLALEARDVATLMKDYADDCVVESPVAGVHAGKKAIEETMQAVFASLDAHIRQQSMLIDGDRVAVATVMEGKDVGQFLGLPPTGKSFRVPLVFWYELRDGKIVHERRIYDFTGLLLQIGLLKAKPAI
jgi:steroid delta-isomerase-like uncharacterized protein